MGCGKNSNDALDKHRGCVCEVVRAIKDIQDTVLKKNVSVQRIVSLSH